MPQAGGWVGDLPTCRDAEGGDSGLQNNVRGFQGLALPPNYFENKVFF